MRRGAGRARDAARRCRAMCVLRLGSRRVSSVMFAIECPSPAPDASIEVHLGKNSRASREKKAGGFTFLFLKRGRWKRAMFAMFVRRIL